MLTSLALAPRPALKPLPGRLSVTLSQGACVSSSCTQCFPGVHTLAARMPAFPHPGLGPAPSESDPQRQGLIARGPPAFCSCLLSAAPRPEFCWHRPASLLPSPLTPQHTHAHTCAQAVIGPWRLVSVSLGGNAFVMQAGVTCDHSMPSPQEVPRRHHPLLELLTWGRSLEQGANNQNATGGLWAAQQA